MDDVFMHFQVISMKPIDWFQTVCSLLGPCWEISENWIRRYLVWELEVLLCLFISEKVLELIYASVESVPIMMLWNSECVPLQFFLHLEV